MSDHAPESSADADEFEPGGGPQRVVSSESVDDILDSLHDAKPNPSETAGTTGSKTERADAANDRERGSTRETGDPSETSADELAARVEAGDVTGADVRAAEAGEGRDETPDIDEIELRVDDLEEPASTIGAAGSDDGPLAGSIDPEEASGDGVDGAESDDGGDGPGLLGRLAGLFSR